MDEATFQDEPTAETAESSPLLDCGQASQATRGLPNQLAFEMGWPPNNRMYFG